MNCFFQIFKDPKLFFLMYTKRKLIVHSTSKSQMYMKKVVNVPVCTWYTYPCGTNVLRINVQCTNVHKIKT